MSRHVVLLSLLVTLLAGCATPYGGRLDIDHRPHQIPGTIAVSDAKLYRREALINERRREMAYIDALMTASEKEGFTIGPEANREIEVIRALALSGGLSVDPAAGKNYQDNRETDRIRHEIQVLQLQLQMEQLRRDAALFREGLATQTVPSSANLGQGGTASGATAPPALTPADTAELVARMEKMQAVLAARLGAEFKPIDGVGLAGNPIDQFRDRAAYRQLLTTARNAASLDELHDLDGAALYRLNFQVSTLPPPDKYLRTAGMVEMRPVSGKPDAEEIKDLYGRWLDHVNKILIESNAADPARFEAQALAIGGKLFDTAMVSYDDGSGSWKKKGVGCAEGLRSSHSDTCPGGRIVVAVPALEAYGGSLRGNDHRITTVLAQDIDGFLLSDVDYSNATVQAFGNGSRVQSVIDAQRCQLQFADGKSNTPSAAQDLLNAAIAVRSAMPHLTQVLRRIASARIDDRQRQALEDSMKRLQTASFRADNVLKRLAEAGCGSDDSLSSRTLEVVVPDEFRKVVTEENKVRVYDIGPRQQVQQVSTAARAAEAFSLAMAVAAKAPNSGAAVKAGLDYSRSATGKVDTIERLPVVVGFAQTGGRWHQKPKQEKTVQQTPSRQAAQEENPQGTPGNLHFGWILGPRISVHPTKGTLELAQGYSVYDLSADLAVTGWRTKLQLEVRTAWSPDWRSKNFSSDLWNFNQDNKRIIEIDLRPSSAEFAALTTRLAAKFAGQRFASVRSIYPTVIKACAAGTLVVEGENLWRATEIVLGGTKIGGTAISVLPDMGGILVDIPQNTNFFGNELDVQVLTPYGVAHASQRLLIDGFDEKGCGEKPDPNAPVLASVLGPVPVNICASPSIEFTGSNLDKITAVRFGNVAGTLTPGTAKKRAATFTRNDLKQIGSDYANLVFFVGEKEVASRAIHVVRLDCNP